MPKIPLINESVLEGLPAALKPRDLDPEKFLAAAGIQRLTIESDDEMLPANAIISLFESLADELDDPVFGVHYAQLYPFGGSGAFGYILCHSKDMRSAVRAIVRYTRLMMTDLDIKYESTDDGGQLTWQFPPRIASPNIQYNSFAASIVVLRLRAGLSPEWSPKLVQLAFREPSDVAVYKKVFGPNILFNQPFNRLTFRNSNLDRPNLAADPRLFNVVKQLGDILLASRDTHSDFKATVANRIIDHLGVASPTLESVSSDMGLSARTVQRRLAEHGTTFETLVGEARRMVAQRLLQDTDLSLTDIALMLGFSELSAFTRAANRWFGSPPRQFRASNRKRA